MNKRKRYLGIKVKGIMNKRKRRRKDEGLN